MRELSRLYRQRFSDSERPRKRAIWRVLCEVFFERYVSPSDTVPDLGAGFCEFINHLNYGCKFTVDMNEETSRFANPDVTVTRGNCAELSFLPQGSVDVVLPAISPSMSRRKANCCKFSVRLTGS
jgi:hypothetical protein